MKCSLLIFALGIWCSLFSPVRAQDSSPETSPENAEEQAEETANDESETEESEPEAEEANNQEETDEKEEPPSPFQALLDNSPFMSKAFKARLVESGNRSAKGFSFQGYAKMDESWIVCIYHSKDKFARWVKVGEEIHGYEIVEIDPKGPTIKLSGHGTEVTLQLENPK